MASSASLTLEEIIEALAYASEGRTNSVKPDLLGNHINRIIALRSEQLQNEARALAIREAADYARKWDESLDETGVPLKRVSFAYKEQEKGIFGCADGILALLSASHAEALTAHERATYIRGGAR